MRIFYCAQSTPNETALPHSRLWHVNLCLPLQDIGHELIAFDRDYLHAAYNLDPERSTDQPLIDQQRPRFGEELLAELKRAHRHAPIDVFFSYFASAHVEADIIREIGKMGIVTINWYCNASYQFHLVRDLAAAYHYCLVPERFRLDDYRQVGATPIFCQEAANPNFYKAHDVPREFDVTFVGQKYGNRPMYINTLIDAGIDVRTWGPYWAMSSEAVPLWMRINASVNDWLRKEGPPKGTNDHGWRYGPPLDDEELIKMYSRSKVSLGFSRVADLSSSVRQVRLRDIEAPMSGAFYMVEYFEELEDCFKIGEEIVCFNDEAELIDKTKYFLAHAQERERIRAAGMRRAREEHTWQQRFAQVFKHIGVS
ncbi:MAG TPA: glycosyltransferase [Nitrospiraceae bacterium]|nr:glycosyltransferase [Nitrospiraceae bacterium]